MNDDGDASKDIGKIDSLRRPELVRGRSYPLGLRCIWCADMASCRVIPENILLCRRDIPSSAKRLKIERNLDSRTSEKQTEEE